MDNTVDIKVGDIVKIVNEGRQYSTFVSMANTLKLKYWIAHNPQKNGFTGQVVSIAPHPQEVTTLYGIRNHKLEIDIIISRKGIELIRPKNDISDDLFVI